MTVCTGDDISFHLPNLCNTYTNVNRFIKELMSVDNKYGFISNYEKLSIGEMTHNSRI